jgi:hypothetical protein
METGIVFNKKDNFYLPFIKITGVSYNIAADKCMLRKFKKHRDWRGNKIGEMIRRDMLNIKLQIHYP